MKPQQGLIFLALMLLSVTGALAQSGGRVAVVNGQPITQQELEKAAAAELKNHETKRMQREVELAQEKQQILTKALDALAAEKMIEAEAAKQKKTKEELLESEVESNVETPSDREVDAFYEANKDRIPIPKEQALPQVKDYMIERSRARFRDMLVARLKKEMGFKSFLEPLRAQIAVAGFPSKGPANAPITIVEFSDFECPYCGQLFPTLKQVEKNYPPAGTDCVPAVPADQHSSARAKSGGGITLRQRPAEVLGVSRLDVRKSERTQHGRFATARR